MFGGKSGDDLYVIDLYQGTDHIVTDWQGVQVAREILNGQKLGFGGKVTDISGTNPKLGDRSMVGIDNNPFADHIEIYDFTKTSS